MKPLIVVVMSLLLLSCAKPTQKQATTLFVGTYTTNGSEGIYSLKLDENGVLSDMKLAAKADNPSFLAFSNDQKYLFAVGESAGNDGGRVMSFQVDGDSLSLVDNVSSIGANPCHVSVKNDLVVVANYTGGNVSWFEFSNGRLSDAFHVNQLQGSGPSDRQKSPHAHSAWFAGETDVLAVDLGSDAVWQFRYEKNANDSLEISLVDTLKTAPGAGPRHLTIHSNNKWLYVVNELDATVGFYELSQEGKWQLKQTIATLPEDFTDYNLCAHILLSKDEQYIYASNRGHNSLVIYKVQTDGSLELVGHELIRGDHPRNFNVTPDGNWLLVANKNTNNIVVFKVKKDTGLLEYTSEFELPSPVCLLFYPS